MLVFVSCRDRQRWRCRVRGLIVEPGFPPDGASVQVRGAGQRWGSQCCRSSVVARPFGGLAAL